MNSANSKNGKKDQPKNGESNKNDLKQELADAQKTIKEQEDEIKKYSNLLEKSKDEIANLKNSKTILKERENDLDQSLQEIENLEKLNEQLRLKNKDLQGEVYTLKNETEQSKEELKKEREKKLEVREVEKEKIQLDKKVNELNQIIKSLEDRISANEKLLLLEPEENGEGILFRIHFYKRQDVFKGRIEHPISKSSKPFTGIDKDTIINFITTHIPKPEEKVEVAEPVPPTPEQKIVPVDMVIANRIGQANQPLKIKLKLNLSKILLGQQLPVTCNLLVYARPLEGGQRQMIAEAVKLLRSADVFDLDLETRSLPRGTYNLETVVTSKLPSGMPAPFNYFSKGGIVHVN